jgi:hypothetical protein
VKHIALRSRCVHSKAPYTAPGLGDRIHSAIVGWAYGCAHGTPVTLHLTADKWNGGQYSNKPESWAEIVALFPADSLVLRDHPRLPSSETEWLAYLREQGYSAELYSYTDHPGKFETVSGFDIVPYLKRIPLLSAKPQDLTLPQRFVTVQWDSNSQARTFPTLQRGVIVERYREAGYTPVVVGGESKDVRLRMSLKHIAFVMSKAECHVGVDSAFLHMAQLYMPWERIHLYNRPDGFRSHHTLRALDNGAKLNPYL